MFKQLSIIALTLTCMLNLTGCGKSDSTTTTANSSDTPPAFTLAWSEYPSWSVFGVADIKGLINGKQGELGPIEKKYNVDIVLKETDYDTCITAYANGQIDAVCITNMDILNPSMGRPAVAIMPTSTSFGADALIVTGIDSVKQLQGKKVYGLEASVSQYTFVRNLEVLGEDVKKYTFTNMDPAAASQAMITRSSGIDAIVVWNPFVLETLKQRTDAKVLFDSTKIPGEIIDMIAMAKTSLEKPGGDAFAKAVAETFYTINKMLADPKTADDTLIAIGSKFSSLGLDKMKVVVQQTQFYKTPADAKALFESTKLKDTMTKVTGFCKSYGIIDSDPSISFDNDAKANLTFTTKYVSQ
jgi:NitT/TauT family transport system substrate-binding protein